MFKQYLLESRYNVPKWLQNVKIPQSIAADTENYVQQRDSIIPSALLKLREES